MKCIRLTFEDIDEDNIYHLYIDKLVYVKIRDGWVINAPNGHRIRKDKRHSDKSQDHIHIYMNGELVVINQDGSKSHDKNGETVIIS